MDQLIPVVNKLHNVLEAIEPEDGDGSFRNDQRVDLPSIVVVGCQSSGKSSVLESLVQRDFLPRGTGIVTRRPLILQLVHNSGVLPSSSSLQMSSSSQSIDAHAGEEWGEFLHLPGKRFSDFAQIRSEIESETIRMAGRDRGISRVPIQLRIYSPHVLNLTLVDLPGITKIPVGEQPVDIEAVIRALVLEYASKPGSIILAVTPANSDLANSDALKIAREADPLGERTLGVLTKIDLMDAGTHAADIICNRGPFRLRLGFVGVVCRSQHDINTCKPIREALVHEAEYFRTHQHYRAISGRCGTVFLARELNKLLLKCIREQLPELRSRINSLILETQAELCSLGDLGLPHGAPNSSSAVSASHCRGAVMLRLLTLYVSDFNEAIQGTGIQRDDAGAGYPHKTEYKGSHPAFNGSFDPKADAGVYGGNDADRNASCRNSMDYSSETKDDDWADDRSLYGGARINYIFNKVYLSALAAVDGTQGMTIEDVRRAIRNASGPRPSLFVPEACFEVLARRQISRFEQPAQRCVDLVYEELSRLLNRTRRSEHRRFPNLSARIVSVALGLLSERLAPTLAMIEALIRIEMAYINTNHPDFCRAGAPLGVLSRIVDERRGLQPGEYAGPAEPPMTSIPADADDSKRPDAFQHSASHGILSYLFRTQPAATGTKRDRPYAATPPAAVHRSAAAHFSMDEREEVETQLVVTLLNSYLYIVRKNIMDSVPKAIMYLMVNHVVQQLSTRLITELYREELFAELLVEDPVVVKHRMQCAAALEAYRQAAAILNDFGTLLHQ